MDRAEDEPRKGALVVNIENIDPALEAFVSSLRAETEAELGLQSRAQDADSSNETWASLAAVDPQLAIFSQALASETEQSLTFASKPSKTVVGIASRPKRRRMVPLVMVAVAAVLAFSLTDLGTIAEFGQGVREQVASMAPWNRGAERNHDRVQAARAKERSRHEASSKANRFSETIAAPNPEASIDTFPIAPQIPLIETSTAVEPVQDPPEPKKAASKPSRRVLSDQALMHKAHRLWKSGNAKAAQRLLRKVAYRSSNEALAQDAFADLFSIGREFGGRAILVKEWNRYLKRYPKGRFAQDAMAGRCLSSDANDKSSQCWKLYLKRFPKGRYARKAKRALDETP